MRKVVPLTENPVSASYTFLVHLDQDKRKRSYKIVMTVDLLF